MFLKILKTKTKKSPQKLPFIEFKRIFSRVPRLTVELVVKNRLGVVLIKREIEPAKGKWHLPGGGVLFGETLQDTVQRVALEEIVARVILKNFLGVLESFSQNSFGHSVAVVFLVRPKTVRLKGGVQGHELRFFKSLPQPTVEEHEGFLFENRLMKSF